MTTQFREFAPPEDSPRYSGLDADAETYSDNMIDLMRLDLDKDDPLDSTLEKTSAPFQGVTVDGTVAPGLFELAAEDAPIAEMLKSANHLLSTVTPSERAKLVHPLTSVIRRRWLNPERYLFRHGLGLDEVSAETRTAIFDFLKTTLSDVGYTKVRDCMYMDAFLGTVMAAPVIMNEYSYNFTFFGEPSLTEPWGWQFHGRHVVMNCQIIGDQMVMTPCFWGGEPNQVDHGPRRGLKLFTDEQALAVQLYETLSPQLRERVMLYPSAYHPAVPPGRLSPFDHIHLCGFSQDNRIIPYEGAPAAGFDAAARDKLVELIEVYHRHLPDGPKAARLADVNKHLDNTYFCWIGGVGPDDPFYYRIQSPVTIIEFDHHAGISLSMMRTPNGNDYGMALIRQYCEAHHHSLAGLDLNPIPPIDPAVVG
jgi:hypothetical protein